MLMPTENPWPLLIVSLLSFVLLMVVATARQTAASYLAAVMCLAIGAAGFAIDAWVVTEREQVEAQIISLVRDFESGDQHRTLAHFSELAIVERLMVGAGMNLVSVAHPLSLKDFSIELSHEDSVATTRFRANGEVLVNGRSVGHQATFWELRWRKEADAWKVIAVQELDPIRGTPQNRAATFTAK